MVAKSLAGFALTAVVCLGFALLASGCGGSKTPAPAASIETTPTSHGTPVADSIVSDSFATKPVVKKPAVDPILLINTSAGSVKVQLFQQKAPQTVDNFLRNYVNRGYYEQTIFHHVDKNSMIAAGGFTPDLQAKPNRAAVYNEAANGLKNTRGTLAMARDPAIAHSATSQFFFNIVDNTGLDFVSDASDAEYGYCVFGQVLEGLDVLDKIAAQPVTAQGDFPSVPTEAVVIQNIQQVQ
ncbi:peptidylprolyl isomerase [Anatilimnocola floriformis]|uniref:peptidylprolyl isomerase n=1 Tax=Anatilimnocola floriformis TaxID=2948575 RepID=UPI0020C53F4E|nr:peptidylprolyl isomerase [Anatilimnocola floriformis]